MPIYTISYIVPLCPNPTGNVRLANGSNKCTGRVEVYRNGQWASVCDDTWDMLSAEVVCKNLQCGKAQKIPETGFFGRGSASVLIEEVSCSGREHSLDQCQLTVGSSTCNSTTVAGVHCAGKITLILIIVCIIVSLISSKKCIIMSPTSCIPDYFDSVQPILKKPGQDLSILNNYQPISKLHLKNT